MLLFSNFLSKGGPRLTPRLFLDLCVGFQSRGTARLDAGLGAGLCWVWLCCLCAFGPLPIRTPNGFYSQEDIVAPRFGIGRCGVRDW